MSSYFGTATIEQSYLLALGPASADPGAAWLARRTSDSLELRERDARSNVNDESAIAFVLGAIETVVEVVNLAGERHWNLAPLRDDLDALGMPPGAEVFWSSYGDFRYEFIAEQLPGAISSISAMELLIGELSILLSERRNELFEELENVADRIDGDLDASRWAVAEVRRLEGVLEQLRAENMLLGEQLWAMERRRRREIGEHLAEIESLMRQKGLDQALIRTLLGTIDERQISRLREIARDLVGGAGLGGTLFGPLGAAAGAVLGLILSARSDRAGDAAAGLG
jgi:hypothetical protein